MFRIYREPSQGEQFVIAADTGNGGGDRCAAHFYSLTSKDVPIVYHSEGIAPAMTDDLIQALGVIADTTGVKPTITYELNNGGFNELVRLGNLNRDQKYLLWYPKVLDSNNRLIDADRPGWTTTEQARRSMLVDLKQAVDNREIRLYDQETITEMYAFVNMKRPGGGWKPQAEVGAHDDLVMSLAITWQIALSTPIRQELKTGAQSLRTFAGGDPITHYGARRSVRTF